MAGRGGHFGIALDHQRFCDQRSGVLPGLAGGRNVQAFERRIIADVIGRRSARNLPSDFAAVNIDGRDAPIGRLDDRESLDVQPGSQDAAAPEAAAVARRRRRSLRWARGLALEMFDRRGP